MMTSENKKSVNFTAPGGQPLILLPQRAVWWPDQLALIVADTHFGKAGTFRQGGIPAPDGIDQSDMARLDDLISTHAARRCIVLGDLFHSTENAQWEELEQWISAKRNCSMELIPGNHDILPARRYEQAGLMVHETQIEVDGLRLVHDPHEPVTDFLNRCTYTLAGHIHPGVRLTGAARQRMMAPCYHMGGQTGVLPAFGRFTGLAGIRAAKHDRVYAVAGNDEEAFVVQVPVRH
jgi:uncharacterized protein